MGIPDKVASLINAEVERRVHEELCIMAEKVAQLYHVPLKIVRKDLLAEDYCLGVKKDGKLCMHKAVTDGYCLKHVHDKRPIQPINQHRGGVRHNHPFPSPPQPNCPACASAKGNEKQFRDLSTIM